ncbi:MAG: chaperone modulator CbpM [Hyphomicrobiaceae bacterium]
MTMKESEVLQHLSGISVIRLRAWVTQGWVKPVASDSGQLFDALDIARCELIRQIEDDLQVASDTVPVILSLLDQVYSLRRELRAVTRAIECQPTDVKRQILASLQADEDTEISAH